MPFCSSATRNEGVTAGSFIGNKAYHSWRWGRERSRNTQRQRGLSYIGFYLANIDDRRAAQRAGIVAYLRGLTNGQILDTTSPRTFKIHGTSFESGDIAQAILLFVSSLCSLCEGWHVSSGSLHFPLFFLVQFVWKLSSRRIDDARRVSLAFSLLRFLRTKVFSIEDGTDLYRFAFSLLSSSSSSSAEDFLDRRE